MIMSASENCSVLPLCLTPEYRSSLREVVYFGKSLERQRAYDYHPSPCSYEYIEHSKYRVTGTRFNEPPISMPSGFDFIAFAIMINLYNTRLLPIDIDNCLGADIVINTQNLLEDERFIGADIINSSKNNWHVIVGIKEPMNVRHILQFFPKVCKGYIACCNDRREAVLRVSRKFPSKDTSSPQYVYAFRKDKDNTPIAYNDFSFPDTGIEDTEEKKKTVRLRV